LLAGLGNEEIKNLLKAYKEQYEQMRHLSSLEVNDDISEEKKAEKIEETVDIAPFHKVGDITDPHKLEIIKIHERKGNSFTYEAKKTSDTDLVLSKETC